MGAIAMAVATLSTPLSAHAAAGALDPTFAGDGIVTFGWGGHSYGNALALAGNGDAIVAGATNALGAEDIAVARLAGDGTFDATFDGDGRLTTNLGGNDYGNAVAVQGDGKIVVAGSTNAAGDVDFAVVRYEATGALDTSFGGDGTVVVGVGTDGAGGDDDAARALVVLPGGDLLVAGEAKTAAGVDYAIVRLDADGSLDATFGSGGIALVDAGSTLDYPAAVAVQGDGKVVIAGITAAGGWRGAVARLTTNGVLDPSFAGDGIATFDAGGGTASVGTLLVDGTGRIVVAGSGTGASSDDFALARFTTGGSLDPTFDGDGIALGGAGGDEVANSIVEQGNGRLVVVGTSTSGGNVDVAAARFTAGGVLDVTYGTAGVMSEDVGNDDYAVAATIGSGGKVTFAGSTWPAANADFLAGRLLPDPEPEPTAAMLRQTTLAGTVLSCGGSPSTPCVVSYNRAPPFTTRSHWRLSPLDGTDLAGRSVQLRFAKRITGEWALRLSPSRTVPAGGVLQTTTRSSSFTPGLWRVSASIAASPTQLATRTAYRYVLVT